VVRDLRPTGRMRDMQGPVSHSSQTWRAAGKCHLLGHCMHSMASRTNLSTFAAISDPGLSARICLCSPLRAPYRPCRSFNLSITLLDRGIMSEITYWLALPESGQEPRGGELRPKAEGLLSTVHRGEDLQQKRRINSAPSSCSPRAC
jgi:hypothetical protein